MVFKRLLGAFGVGGPSVETVLHESHGRPGGHLPGEVTIQGGDHDVHVQQVVLSLVTNVEFEHGDHEGAAGVEFYRGAIAGGFHLGAGQYHSIPFQMPLPWELPLTEVYGQHLHGMAMGVRTELEIAGARDAGDLDPVSIGPLPSQQRVLDAFGALGFQFKSADVEQGHIAGVHQELPFYQEIEFYAPPQYSGQINEVELTFVANPHELAVVLEADRRGTIFSEGDDVFGRFHVSHDEALHMAWEQELENWLRAVAGHLHGGTADSPPSTTMPTTASITASITTSTTGTTGRTVTAARAGAGSRRARPPVSWPARSSTNCSMTTTMTTRTTAATASRRPWPRRSSRRSRTPTGRPPTRPRTSRRTRTPTKRPSRRSRTRTDPARSGSVALR
ncbi:sporulation protein [Actinomadura keratinilytica]|uniref:sporulation protein n=1 Tax=Actinomadura keratinilytica TaxID=547461 RepID=UPI003617736E